MNKQLRLEGCVMLLLCMYLYDISGFSWVWFAILFFVPDIMILPYMISVKVGATMYNIIHNYAITLALIIIGLALKLPVLVQVGIIFSAHISMDRFLGYGLKYNTNFKDTHMSHV